jgi:hypothetical protein
MFRQMWSSSGFKTLGREYCCLLLLFILLTYKFPRRAYVFEYVGCRADNLIAICEPIVQKMWEPRRLTTLWSSTACYGDSFTFFYLTRYYWGEQIRIGTTLWSYVRTRVVLNDKPESHYSPYFNCRIQIMQLSVALHVPCFCWVTQWASFYVQNLNNITRFIFPAQPESYHTSHFTCWIWIILHESCYAQNLTRAVHITCWI